jgi:hypothetical protein
MVQLLILAFMNVSCVLFDRVFCWNTLIGDSQPAVNPHLYLPSADSPVPPEAPSIYFEVTIKINQHHLYCDLHTILCALVDDIFRYILLKIPKKFLPMPNHHHVRLMFCYTII